MDIPQSKVYLTLGNVEQLYYVLGRRIRCLYHPSTADLTKEIETPVLFEDPDVLVWPLSQSATGLIKARTTTAANGAIPSDQFVRVATGKRVFIMFCGVDGLVTKADANAAKKLAGGCFEVLDLRTQHFKTEHPELDSVLKEYPLTAKHSLAQLLALDADINFLAGELACTAEIALIASLKTTEGIGRWGCFSPAEVYRYFLLTNFQKPPLLVWGRAWGLEPYLAPFVNLIKADCTAANPSAHLARFAAWVYGASRYWASTSTPGLTYYQPPKGLGYYRFNPSVQAKRHWHAILKGDLLRPSKTKYTVR